MPQEELLYSIDIQVNRVLTESEKTKLMVALGNAVKEVLGEAKSGTIMVYSERKDEPGHDRHHARC